MYFHRSSTNRIKQSFARINFLCVWLVIKPHLFPFPLAKYMWVRSTECQWIYFHVSQSLVCKESTKKLHDRNAQKPLVTWSITIDTAATPCKPAAERRIVFLALSFFNSIPRSKCHLEERSQDRTFLSFFSPPSAFCTLRGGEMR